MIPFISSKYRRFLLSNSEFEVYYYWIGKVRDVNLITVSCSRNVFSVEKWKQSKVAHLLEMKDRAGAVTAAKQIRLASFFRMLSTRKIMPATKLRPRNTPATMPTLCIVLIVSGKWKQATVSAHFSTLISHLMPALRKITLVIIICYDW